ncbi:MAG: tRNA 5-methoxyuridine(34)/uridine 5-oxyacetic acid(34) synthase CmoB [Gammaproteobacteria bacterium]|nr:tRNA 5-methoxyuridine(34)/uridine 5-oxyacetic acid(34) synthase CmoB [Gammaproteobacteria bacterium]
MNPAAAGTLPAGCEALAPLITARLAPAAHGDLPRWLAALQALPDLAVDTASLGDTVTFDGPASAAQRRELMDALQALHPWRKGPFRLFGVDIDTEWRSDWKWQRVAPGLASLHGQRVLDVGCGNGYFGWRMLEAGAAEVVGVDPTIVFALQHRAVNHYARSSSNHVLPVRFEEMPEIEFDTVFSMGVIYHRRDPQEHTMRLFRHTRPGGQVVLESLVVAGPQALHPRDRYARMRNVHVVPTAAHLCRWLEAAGFDDARLTDETTTTTGEQRSTAWMRFQSLADSLQPGEPSRTVEGYPAPRRAVVVARKPV